MKAFGISCLYLLAAPTSFADITSSSNTSSNNNKQEITKLKSTVEQLERKLELVLTQVADQQEITTTSPNHSIQLGAHTGVHIGGYGEMHYRNLSVNDDEIRELDFHRMVLFFAYDFNERVHFISEFEIEHIIAGANSRGAVELEQVYLEFDLSENSNLQTGALLMPIGIINETHEPNTFYGVERPIVETTVIPTTWWSNGIKYSQHFNNGLHYDLMISEGLKTEDPGVAASAEPFNLKKGKQKGSFADAFDLATTGRVRYTGQSGLEISVYGQYQPDLDQSAITSYASDATLLGGHIIYQHSTITTKLLYAQWNLGGQAASEAGKNNQNGGYIEINWEPLQQWGFYVRQSAWTLSDAIDNEQTDFGLNYYPYDGVVFKADIQIQNEEAGDADGFGLAMGYAF